MFRVGPSLGCSANDYMMGPALAVLQTTSRVWPQPWLFCKQVHDGRLPPHPADVKTSVTLHPVLQDISGRFFGSSWVVEWAPGHYADVAHAWESYRAARTALAAAHINVQQVRSSVFTPTHAQPLLAKPGPRPWQHCTVFSRSVRVYLKYQTGQ